MRVAYWQARGLLGALAVFVVLALVDQHIRAVGEGEWEEKKRKWAERRRNRARQTAANTVMLTDDDEVEELADGIQDV